MDESLGWPKLEGRGGGIKSLTIDMAAALLATMLCAIFQDFTDVLEPTNKKASISAVVHQYNLRYGSTWFYVS